MNESDKVSVREYIESLLTNYKESYREKFIEFDKRIEANFKYLGTSINLAKAELDRRLEGMNEFRQQIDDRNDTFVDKGEQSIIDRQFEERLRAVEVKRAELGGMTYLGIIILSVVGGAIAAFILGKL